MRERAADGGAAFSLLSVLLQRAEGFLLEPPAEGADRGAATPAPPAGQPVVAVCGLRARVGVTTVARALAVELARRDPAGAAAVSASAPPAGLPLGTASAARLAQAATRRSSLEARASGRLCLLGPAEPAEAERAVAGLAPLVIDAGLAPAAGAAASLATAAVLVAAEVDEPALADVLAARLGRVGPEPFVVVNPVVVPAVGRWAGRAGVEIPRSRACARLAGSGRVGAGGFADAVAALADLCEGR